MHPDLPRLLTLQNHDLRLAQLADQRRALILEQQAMDQAQEQLAAALASAREVVIHAAEARDQAGQGLEKQRELQERRKSRLEQESNPRVATQLLTDLEMTRGMLAQEESEWLRLAEEVTSQEEAAAAAEAREAESRAEQQGLRDEHAAAFQALETEIQQVKQERETAAAAIDATLLHRYDRLRSSRKNKPVVVPVVRNACTGCYTTIPSSKIGPLRSQGVLLEGCQMCGAIMYLPPEES